MTPITVTSIKDLPKEIPAGTALFLDVWPEEPVVDPDEIDKYQAIDDELMAAILERTVGSVRDVEDVATDDQPVNKNAKKKAAKK